MPPVKGWKTGVYQIRNKVNGKVYIGSTSSCFKERWRNHRCQLGKKRHHSIHLQRAWDKYGESNFEFEILLRCPASLCIQKEQEYMDALKSYKCAFGYNRNHLAHSRLGQKASDETRRRNSEANRNRSPEIRKRMSEAQKKRYERPEEREKARRAVAKRRKGIKYSPESCKRISDAIKLHYAKKREAEKCRLQQNLKELRCLRRILSLFGEAQNSTEKMGE